MMKKQLCLMFGLVWATFAAVDVLVFMLLAGVSPWICVFAGAAVGMLIGTPYIIFSGPTFRR